MSEQSALLIDRTFASSRDELKELPAILGGVKERCSISEDRFYNLVIAVTEAVNNAIVHGNKLDESKQVHYRIECAAGGVRCTVEDQGPGFDVEDISDPLNPENLLREGGRGIFLIRMLMEEFQAERIEGGMRISFFCPAA